MSLFEPPKFKKKSEADVNVSDTNISEEIDEISIQEEISIINIIKNEEKHTKNAKIHKKRKTIKRNRRNKIYAKNLSLESIELNIIKELYAVKIGSTTNKKREEMINGIIDIWNREKLIL